MIERLAEAAQPLLQTPLVRRTRRNHGLEHATIHLLSRRVRGLRMAGRSDDQGFVLIGQAPTEAVEQAAHEALRRMRQGERGLAIHPNCGTNLVTTGFMGTAAAAAALGGGRRITPDRLAWSVVAVMLATLAAQPVGTSLQRHITTDGDPGDTEIISITRREVRLPFGAERIVIHQVLTRGG